MKKVLLLITAVCCVVAVCAQDFTAIKGKVKDQWLSQVKLFKTVDGTPVVCAVSRVEADGSFGFLVKPEKPGFYVIGEDERMNFPVYVKGGEEINIELQENKANLIGKNTRENVQLYKWVEYAYHVWLKSVFFDRVFSTYEDFFPDFEKFVAGLSELKAGLKSGNKEFDALLREWIDYATDYYAVVFLQTPRSKHPKVSDRPEYYKQIINSKKFADERVLDFPNGITMLRLYSIFAVNEKDVNPADKALYEQTCLEAIPSDRLRGEFVVSRFFSEYRTYEEYLDGMKRFEKYWLSPSLKALKSNEEVIDYVATTPDALGVIGANWIGNKTDTTRLSFNQRVRVMSVSGNRKATPENSYRPYQAYLALKKYPLTHEVYILINDPKGALPTGLMTFLTRERGQRIILKSGLVPATQPVRIVNVKDDF